MAFWDIDLETRMGAESAADQGKLACFIYAGFSLFGAVFFGAVAGFDTVEGMITSGITLLQAIVAVIAGLRLRAGKGAFWGIAVAALIALGVLNQLAAMAIGVGLVISIILLVFVIQGIRGAFALRKSNFAEDELEVFE